MVDPVAWEQPLVDWAGVHTDDLLSYSWWPLVLKPSI